jgi:ribosomal protein L16 Arg81 hydroxylase
MEIGDLPMSEVNLKQMSVSELKKYLSDHRNDNEKFSSALGEFMSRDVWTSVPADTSLAEQEAIIKQLINRKENSQ